MAREDTLFARFRRTGEPAALAALFDATADDLLRLAQFLTRDPHAAEDLVQETFVTAIEEAGAFDAGRSVVPWLVGILANRARRRRRDAGRTPQPERLPNPIQDPVADAMEHELDGTLRQLIGSLPEPYRPVLELHVGCGFSAGEIAAELRRPGGTVRTQLMRGLELLRKALPAGLAAGALGAAVPTRGLVAVRAAVLAHAAAAPAAATAAGGGFWIGAMLMNVKWMTACGVAVLALVSWLAWPRALPEPAPSRPSGPKVAAALGAEPPASVPSAGTPSQAVRRRRVASAPAPALPSSASGTLRVRALWADSGAPAADVQVVCAPFAELAELLEQEQQTGPDGIARFTGLVPGKFKIHADRGGQQSGLVEVAAGQLAEVDLELPAGVQVDGVVLDARNAPVAGASVWLSGGRRDARRGRVVARTDGGGRFQLLGVEPERLLSAWATGFRPARVELVDGKNGQRITMEIRLEERCEQPILGRVLDSEDRPVAGAMVGVGAFFPMGIADTKSPLFKVFPARVVRTAPDGVFRFESHSHGQPVLWVRAAGFAPARPTFEPGREAIVHLVRGATLVGHVLMASGEACRLARIEVETEVTRRGPREAFTGPDWVQTGGVVSSDASYRIPHLPPGVLGLVANGWGADRAALSTRAERSGKDGEDVVWEARLGVGGPIVGMVVDPRGAPLAGWEVSASPPKDAQGNMPSATTDARGYFELKNCEPLPYTLEVRMPKTSWPAPAAVLRGVLPGIEVQRLEVPDRAVCSASVTGRVVTPRGEPVAGADIMLREDNTVRSATGKSEAGTGTFRIGPVPPGRYRAHFRAPGAAASWTDTFTLAADQTRDLGALAFESPGTIVATVLDPEGKPLTCMLGIQSLESPYLGLCPLAEGAGRSKELRPGQYLVYPFRGEYSMASALVDVRAGEESKVRLELPRTVLRDIRYTRPTMPMPFTLRLVWRDQSGRVRSQVTTTREDEKLEGKQSFPLGSFELEATDETGRSARTTVVITSLQPSAEVIELRLP